MGEPQAGGMQAAKEEVGGGGSGRMPMPTSHGCPKAPCGQLQGMERCGGWEDCKGDTVGEWGATRKNRSWVREIMKSGRVAHATCWGVCAAQPCCEPLLAAAGTARHGTVRPFTAEAEAAGVVLACLGCVGVAVEQQVGQAERIAEGRVGSRQFARRPGRKLRLRRTGGKHRPCGKVPDGERGECKSCLKKRDEQVLHASAGMDMLHRGWSWRGGI